MESPRWHAILSGLWLCILTVLGTFLNSIVLFAYAKDRKRIKPNDVLVIGILANHACMSVTAFILPAIAEFTGGWFVVMTMDSCIFEGFTVYWFGLASEFIVMVIALTRYLSITQPMRFFRFSNRIALITVLMCQVTAFLLALAPLFGWSSYGLEAHQTSCGLDWTDRRVKHLVYLAVICVIGYAIPIAVMVFSYLRIFQTVRKTSVAAAAGNNPSSRRNLSQARKEKRLIIMGVAMVVVYIVSWTPYAVISFYIAFGKPAHVDPVVSRIPSLFAKTEVLWNPVIYTLTTWQFRRKVYEILPCMGLKEWLKKTDPPTVILANDTVMMVTAVQVTTSSRMATLPIANPPSTDAPVNRNTIMPINVIDRVDSECKQAGITTQLGDGVEEDGPTSPKVGGSDTHQNKTIRYDVFLAQSVDNSN